MENDNAKFSKQEMTFDEACEINQRIKRNPTKSSYYLLDMRNRNGWKVMGYKSFVEYGTKELNFSKIHFLRFVRCAEIVLQIGCSIDDEHPPLSQLLQLSSVSDINARKTIWMEAVRKAKSEHSRLTEGKIRSAVNEWKRNNQNTTKKSNVVKKSFITPEDLAWMTYYRGRYLLHNRNNAVKFDPLSD